MLSMDFSLGGERQKSVINPQWKQPPPPSTDVGGSTHSGGCDRAQGHNACCCFENAGSLAYPM